MCIWQLRNVFAVKNVHAIVYLFNSIALPQSENSFLLFAWRFFLKLRQLHWVTLVILGSKGELPVIETLCKVCGFLTCWYTQLLVYPVYCAELIMYESQASSLLPNLTYFFLLSWGIIWILSFPFLSSKDEKLAQAGERIQGRMHWYSVFC